MNLEAIYADEYRKAYKEHLKKAKEFFEEDSKIDRETIEVFFPLLQEADTNSRQKMEIMPKSDKDCYIKLCDGIDCSECEEGNAGGSV